MDQHYLEIFDNLFKKKLKIYYEKACKKADEGTEEEINARMFCFAEKKMKQIEEVIQRNYELMQTVEQVKCTKLDNEGKATTDIEI